VFALSPEEKDELIARLPNRTSVHLSSRSRPTSVTSCITTLRDAAKPGVARTGCCETDHEIFLGYLRRMPKWVRHGFPARSVVVGNEELAGKWVRRGSKRSDALKFEPRRSRSSEGRQHERHFMSTAMGRTWRYNDRIWRRTQTVQGDGI